MEIRLVLFTIFMSCSFASQAKPTLEAYQQLLRFKNCFESSGQHYNISPNLLMAIAFQESSGDSGAINQRELSLGLMQIHPQHHDLLKQFGISKKSLFDACQNIAVGAWVLSHCIAIFGETWDSVGCYNAGTNKNKKQDSRRKHYANKISRHLKLINQFAASM